MTPRAAAPPLAARVFAALADGRFHSGQELARDLGVSRSAVWKAAGALRELGATLHAVRNRGYRLPSGRDALDAGRIRSQLPPEAREHVRDIQAVWTVDSTNSALLARPNPPCGKSEILLAEYQTAGRGRRGRAWLAPPGGAICLSLSWTFREVPRDLGALGLVVGVCILRARRAAGLTDLNLKWPNDVLFEGRKLGGVLIELRAEGAGNACVVIGMGLNVALGAPLLEAIGRTGVLATDLVGAGLTHPSRNALAAALIAEVLRALPVFEAEALRPFVEEWRAADALRARPIEVRAIGSIARGLARGIDLHGALLLETPQGVRRFVSGDVTVRPVQ